MSIAEHCLPTGTLATHELPVPNIPGIGTVQDPGPPRRGVVVLCHGLFEGINPGQLSVPADVTGFLNDYSGTLSADLQADGWVVYQLAYPEDNYSFGAPSDGLIDDVSNDAGFGARYLATTLRMWDHIVAWRNENYPGAPLFPIGGSHGGWEALTLASLRSSQIVAAIGYIPATIWSNASTVFVGNAFGDMSTVGMDLGPHALDATTIPILVSYGTSDQAVGWAGATTVDAASNTVDVSTFTGSGTLHIANTAGITVGPQVKVVTSGGFATITFSGIGAGTPGTLTGCRTMFGTGTLSTGNPVTQSNTAAMIANAGANVTSHVGVSPSNHDLQLADVSAFMSWITTNVHPLAPAIH